VKIIRWATLATLFLVAASMATADGVGPDPRFILVGGGHSTQLISPTDPAFVVNYEFGVTEQVEGGCQSFGAPDGECIFVDFINNSGVAWNSIQFQLSSVVGGLEFSVDPHPSALDPYFTQSSFDDGILRFFGTDETHPGIQPATFCNTDGCTGPFFPGGGDFPVPQFDFGILVDVSDAQFAGAKFTATGTATPVPEPRSIFLMLAGAAILGLYLGKKA
jgi:hypothetical protein